MSMLVRGILAAVLSLTVVSNAAAQNSKPRQVKPFTAAEKLYFDRASVMTGGAAGGGGGGGADGGGGFWRSADTSIAARKRAAEETRGPLL
jgi:hypothetical protein